jgi:NhaP-type Na+/H+ or K+/H+ antiporter
MDSLSIAVIAAALLAWALVSRALDRVDVTGPMALALLGLVAHVVGLVDIPADDAPVGLVAEATLALVLFSDAARVDVSRLRHDAAVPVRMLVAGLPLVVLAGAAAARGLDIGDSWALAVLIGACLAPTDAGLGAVVVNDTRVPRRIRRILNVESGLNDGIAAPVVTLAVTLALSLEVRAVDVASDAATQIGVGVAVGVAVGLGGGVALWHARAAGLIQPGAVQLAALALAVLANAGAQAGGGNGFIGAFVAGLAFGPAARMLSEAAAARRRADAPDPATDDEAEEAEAAAEGQPPLDLTELAGQLLGSVVWFLFGAVLLGPVLTDLSWRLIAYAVLSLTVVRMVPMALVLVGAGLDRATVGFLGWFGPRGLASLVFAIEALDELGPDADPVVAAVTLTVALSVVVHGATAGPLATSYGRWAARQHPEHPARMPVPEMRSRSRMAGRLP